MPKPTVNKRIQVLSAIFRPAVMMMDRFKYAHKFILVSLVFMVPICLLFYVFFAERNASVQLTEREKTGVAYSMALNDVLLQVQEHRSLASVQLLGMGSFEDAAASNQEELSAAILRVDELFAADSRYPTLKEEWQSLKEEWNSISQTYSNLSPSESNVLHSNWTASLLEFNRLVADQTNLNLDPEIASSYLVEALTSTVPRLAEDVSLSQSLATGLIVSKEMTASDDEKLITHINSITEGIQNLRRVEQAIYRGEPALEAVLSEPITAYIDISERLAEYVKIVRSNHILDMDPTTVLEMELQSTEARLALKGALSQELYAILDQRVTADKVSAGLTITMIAVVFLVAAYLFVGFYFAVRHAVSKLRDASTAIASGDLTVQANLKGKDELSEVGTAFDSMVEKWRAIIRENQQMASDLAESSKQLLTASQQAAQSSDQITNEMAEAANMAETQLSGAEQSTRAMQEIATGISRIAESSSSVAESSAEATQRAQAGNGAIGEVSSQMSSISDTMDKLATVVQEMGDKSRKIEEIVGVISEISQQTQLLSLNASIEAARAGEHGRGFTVVAAEVKKLAEQSRSSTFEIADIVRDILITVDHAVMSMKDSVQEVAKGRQLAGETGQSFASIMAAVEHVNMQVQEISAAAEEISAGSEQVSASLDEMLDITRKNTDITQNVSAAAEEQLASNEEISASSESLQSMAARLQKEMNQFKV
ncbi:methyl-accepting chemotaxis protein [Xylanibacillus composti]|uniref:Methyl-accepting chemotaxis protein n=1 Tax=Xylanibacillus composti TaxID=1572762 RepID=A0A8J4H0V5_9BACL|nr:HAMP domain-containing methyl-accepting chemotaxis protein [Xylanibacillus composti]MDT9725789.1 methyl-accepting chemotaxis protein [Xylanibacillus composti]GIQ67495.1 methyl-accepting chemotaxis protein [Xylanibacillus composti]